MPEIVYASEELRECFIVQSIKGVQDFVRDELKKREAAAKAARVPLTKHTIDKDLVREAIMHCQYEHDFWKNSNRLRPFYKNNGQGPVTWDPEYRAYKADKARKHEQAAQETRIKRIQEDMKASGKHTITVGEKTIVVPERKDRAQGGAKKARLSISDLIPEAVDDVCVAGPARGPEPVVPRAVPARAPAQPALKTADRKIMGIMNQPMEIFKGPNDSNATYIYTDPHDDDAHDELVAVGCTPYGKFVRSVFMAEDSEPDERASRIFEHQDSHKHVWSLMNVRYKPQEKPSYLPEQFNSRLIPAEVVEARVELIQASLRDDFVPADADSIERAWAQFTSRDAAERYASSLERINTTKAQLESYMPTFNDPFMTSDKNDERHCLIKSAIDEGLFSLAEYKRKLRKQMEATMTASGVKQGHPADEATMRDYLVYFTELEDYQLMTKDVLDKYLDTRKKLLEARDKLVQPGFIATFEASHGGLSFDKIYDGFDGIWDITKQAYEVAFNFSKINAALQQQFADLQAAQPVAGPAAGPDDVPIAQDAGKKKGAARKGGRSTAVSVQPSRSPSPDPGRPIRKSARPSRANSRFQSPEPSPSLESNSRVLRGRKSQLQSPERSPQADTNKRSRKANPRYSNGA
jgi:hypothetical protein